jgi:iron-only hydrogenase group A
MTSTKKIQISINNKKLDCQEGETILKVAKRNKIEIPALCYHPDLGIKANCQLCLIEIAGWNGLHRACSTKVEQKMKITTKSPTINRTRKTNLELLFSQHCQKCQGCIWNFNCEILRLAKEYKAEINKFPERKKTRPTYNFGSPLFFDSAQCIDCQNCVDVCKKQGVGFLEIKGSGPNTKIVPSTKKDKDCIYCGQCIVHCPVGAFEAKEESKDVEKAISDKKKIVVFQFAPSIRSSIGECFNLPYGSVVTDKLTAGIKKLGADKVFDVSVGSDFTTIEEAKELIERLEENKNLPMLTSCCPSWVKFVEFYYPEFIPYLTSVKSPQIILGGIIKTFWAKKEKIDPKKIVVVSVMPCVSKKYEIRRKEMQIDGIRPVDFVLTTRELAFLFKKNGINLKTIKPENPDSPLGTYSGAGVIYGASGGVMESALRTAYEKITKKNLPKIEFKNVRGLKGTKKASIKIGEKTLKIGIINGIGNAKKVLEELKKDPQAYHYIEIMACFGGCIGGGGQPVPTSNEIRKKRAKTLYKIDDEKKLRLAHKNPVVKKIYEDFLTSKEKIHLLCHTKYSKKPKEVKF